MKKPEDISEYTWINDEGVNIFPPFFYFEELPQLIEWLKEAQKYHEFKSKKKLKTKSELSQIYSNNCDKKVKSK